MAAAGVGRSPWGGGGEHGGGSSPAAAAAAAAAATAYSDGYEEGEGDDDEGEGEADDDKGGNQEDINQKEGVSRDYREADGYGDGHEVGEDELQFDAEDHPVFEVEEA